MAAEVIGGGVVHGGASGGTFYRVIKRSWAIEEDFYSYERLGKPLRFDTARARRLARGVSLFDTLEAAAHARAIEADLGSYAAVLAIAPGMFEMEQGRGDPHHWTIWGSPRELLLSVVQVVPL